MRYGARHNAITNSPIIRALLKTKKVTLPPSALKSNQPSEQDPASVDGLAPVPPGSFLISTQPPPSSKGSPETDKNIGEGSNAGKKRKRDSNDEGDQDDSEEQQIVYYTYQTLPPELRKYWNQRYRLFSLFDQGCQMDIEGWYSVTPENIAAQIAERCRCGVVVDAFCGVGGNAIQFAFTCEKVIAIDNSLTRLACAKHNAKVYGVDDRITFILGDFVTWSKEYVKQKSEGKINKDEEVEVVFLSPPWGGIDYQKAGSSPSSAKRPKTTSHQIPDTPTPATSSTSSEFYPLSALAPLHGKELFKLARDMTPHVAYYLPRNVDVGQLARLPLHAPRSDKGKGGGKGTVPERIEIEEEWMGTKMKAVTVYFGDLTKGAVAQDSEPGEGEGAVEGNDR